MIASTPKPPYYAVIFTNQLNDPVEGYGEMAEQMLALAKQQPGFLGFESARDGQDPKGGGISVSYWQDLESIKAWKADAQHQQAQQLGKEQWYRVFKTRVALVERDYGC